MNQKKAWTTDTLPKRHQHFHRRISERVVWSDPLSPWKKKSIYENNKKRGKNRLTLSFDRIPTKFGADWFIKFGTKRLEARVTVWVLENCSDMAQVGNQVIPYSVICLVAKCLDHFQYIRSGHKASTTLQRTKVNIKGVSSKSWVTFEQFSMSVALTWVCLLCHVIGTEISNHPLNQSHSKIKPIAVTRVFPRFRRFVCFYFAFSLAACDTFLSSDWLLRWLWLSSITLIASLLLWEFVYHKIHKIVRTYGESRAKWDNRLIWHKHA